MPKQTDLKQISTYAEKVDRALHGWNVLERPGSRLSITLTPTDGEPIHMAANAMLVDLVRNDLARMYHEAGEALMALGVEPKGPPESMLKWAESLPGNQ